MTNWQFERLSHLSNFAISLQYRWGQPTPKKPGGGQGFGILLQDLPNKFIIAQSLHEVLLKILLTLKRS